MGIRNILFGLFLGTGCEAEKGYVSFNSPPQVAFIEPVDNTEYEQGDQIAFLGTSHDDEDVGLLVIDWSSSIDGVLSDLDPPDVNGQVDLYTSSLSPGDHVITLRATDEEAAQGEATLQVVIMEVPELPSIAVIHPEIDEVAVENIPFVFMVSVSDLQDTPDQLLVEMSSSFGFICFMTIEGSGTAQCAERFPTGSYIVTFRVFDLDGNHAEAIATHIVVSTLDFDADGDGLSPNGGDCNDDNPNVYPGAPEVCDGLDNDCNELTGIDMGGDCSDDDGDNYCEVPPCVNATGMIPDCDDTLVSVFPSAIEVLNGIDDDCDGIVDEGTVVYDDDGDGFCESPPCINTSNSQSDCNDADHLIFPTAIEVCNDGFDNNCNGMTNEENAIGCMNFHYDGDGDTFGVIGQTECWCEAGNYPFTGLDANDCYDVNASVNPLQVEYFSVDRGDGSFDYDCSNSQEKLWQGINGGCSWDFFSITCDENGTGWESSEPSCGQNGLFVDDCDASYSAFCYALCLMSSNVINCLISNCGASCNPEYDARTQSCR